MTALAVGESWHRPPALPMGKLSPWDVHKGVQEMAGLQAVACADCPDRPGGESGPFLSPHVVSGTCHLARREAGDKALISLFWALNHRPPRVSAVLRAG